MKRNVSIVRFKFILISGNIIKEMPVSVASGTLYFHNSMLHILLPPAD